MPDGATVKTSKAAVGYQYCNKLFTLEKKCADQKAKYRREYLRTPLREITSTGGIEQRFRRD